MTEILRSFGWMHVVDLGNITSARGTEMYVALWLRVWGAIEPGTVNIAVVHEPMSDRTCLVTGGTSGIGNATAHALAAMDATTILVARDRARGEAAVEEIRSATGNDRVEVLLADPSSQAAIRELVETFGRTHDRLDVLVNCAGAFFRWRRVTGDGLEMTFALNHLSYFLLTNLLLDVLEQSGAVRVLNVTAPATTRIDFDDLQGERRYRPFTAFGASKVANLMFTFELARRLAGTGLTANAVHPGRVRSNNMREAPAPFRLLTRLLSGSTDRAGAVIAHLATAPEFAGKTGRFYRGRKEIRASTAAMDEGLQRRLWQVSEELTGLEIGEVPLKAITDPRLHVAGRTVAIGATQARIGLP